MSASNAGRLGLLDSADTDAARGRSLLGRSIPIAVSNAQELGAWVMVMAPR